MDNIRQIKQHLASVQGQSLTLEERIKKAITLAGIILDESQRIQTFKERKDQEELHRMMQDSLGKVFTMSLTDQCFRSHHPERVASQILHLLDKYGIPHFLSLPKRLMFAGFKLLGCPLADISVPLVKQLVRQKTASVILPGESDRLFSHIRRRAQEGVRINLNHLGEAILGEEEAQRRLQMYLDDLAHPEVKYISIKISTLFSQINLLAWEKSIAAVSESLKKLYRAAQKHTYKYAGKRVPKFVNLDMEEYRDLRLTVDIFRHTLDDPEFFHYSAGLALQSYLPDSFAIQQELTEWAMERVLRGGAPISIRIVKGANLAMEQVEASLRNWCQAPYANKKAVDANYKRMLHYGAIPKHIQAVHIGVATHNLFDIAYALLLRSENQLGHLMTFEMLEGMADPMRRVVQRIAGEVLLYCPAATVSEFQNAVAYLIRRLDENTAPENFLRHSFGLKPGSLEWHQQAKLFESACMAIEEVESAPRRQQNRLLEPEHLDVHAPFDNEADTDWTLPMNRQWAQEILHDWEGKTFNHPIPLVINDKTISESATKAGYDPSYPNKELYYYTLAQPHHIEEALQSAQKAQMSWKQVTVKERANLLIEVAKELRRQRGALVGAMIADTGKTIYEADVEVSEAIDFAEYYWRLMLELEGISDVRWKPKGTILIAPPWNFPCSIPAGGILASLMTGNCVLFKPAPEAVLVGWVLVQIFWKAGVGKQILQFIPCLDEPVGSQLVCDLRLDAIVLTGATETAKLLLRMRPGVDLMAETGGKNAMIISNMSDRDLAIKDLVQSAFGHAGQKCSACSLAICHKEVYNDPHFRRQLRDAASSMHVGSPWDPATRINPLIRPPNSTLLRGLTTLEEGEEWLLEPKQDVQNPQLWSPGIKLGVTKNSFSYKHELFGPVLSLMCAEDFDHAIALANGTSYGLTSGIESLDELEIEQWLRHIEAGNCYVNRGITGAIVQRQPFGGCKESSFGRGLKAGGPNYLMQFMEAEQILFPPEEEIPSSDVVALGMMLAGLDLIVEEKDWWQTSVSSYAYYFNNYFVLNHDSVLLLGQDNLLHYTAHHYMIFRIQQGDALIDVIRVIAAAMTCGTPLVLSVDLGMVEALQLPHSLPFHEENEEQFIATLSGGQRIRFLKKPSEIILKACAELACHIIALPVIANGRVELLHYLREVSISNDYHRYGNLGDRENEKRGKQAMSHMSQSCCGRKTLECDDLSCCRNL